MHLEIHASKMVILVFSYDANFLLIVFARYKRLREEEEKIFEQQQAEKRTRLARVRL